MTRSPIVAGTFYQADPTECRQAVEDLFRQADQMLGDKAPAGAVGGLVPHAGWVCSGAIAAMTLRALVGTEPFAGTFILLGAVHALTGPQAMLYDRGAWATPLGDLAIDAEMAAAIAAAGTDIDTDPHAHSREHSLEVQAPLIQALCPQAKIVPILVPPSPRSAAVGRQVAKAVAELTQRPLIVGSTDLTHYGPRYGITVAGIGDAGVDWAMENDRRLLDMVVAMDAERVVAEAAGRHNACGGGAIAATIAACEGMGAERGTLLKHTNSCETLKDYFAEDHSNSVGYASVVFA